ncbi:DUF4238 domain-containing protein [Alcaligenes faecalis]|uniref:DUF4238 domain-containing protein n=1 Tax=Alcaligenes faecalis TaxID=511 RepID=UPI002AA7F511|nr:DUF4238 domain-containing protein [Alcaligenes faecalis]
MARKHLEAKKRHHYVWAKYLTRWGSGTRNVFYTTKTGKIAHDSVRAIAAEDYLYKITSLTKEQVDVIKSFSRLSPESLQQQHMSYLNDFLRLQQAEASYRNSGVRSSEAEHHLHVLRCNLLENLHASHEKAVQPVLEALAYEQLGVLQDKQHMIEFMTFLGHQFCRTKPFRDVVIRSLARSNAKEVFVADAVAHAWWFISYMFGMSFGCSLYLSRNEDKHALLINDTSVPFITSDHPVVNVHPCVSETAFVAPEHSDLYYPISPRIAYIICNSERFVPGRNAINETTAVELNSKLASQAMVHIVGNSEDAIRPFQRFIGRRAQKAQKQ